MARVKYLPYGNGKRVSTQWHRVLTKADKDGVRFTLTSGHRTFEEQQKLRDAYERFLNGGPWAPIAAKPSHTAPHIRTGNPAHALDINSLDGGETRFERWIERQGASIEWLNTVVGEAWHGEVSREDLARLFRKFRPKPKPRPPQTLSLKGQNFLIVQEGVRRYAYNDSQNNATFGVGHLIHDGPVTNADRERWGTQANPKPMAVVRRVLEADVKEFEKAVRESTGRRLSQPRFDACVSLAFNIGAGGFKRSTVARELRGKKKGFVQRAGDAFLLWNNPPELIARRRRERRLFLRGDYGPWARRRSIPNSMTLWPWS